MPIPLSCARRRVGLALVVSLLIFAIAPTAPVAAANTASCSGGAAPPLSLLLRDVTINQGLGSYTLLARGKQTIVRLFLSLPSNAASDASMAVTGTTLTLNNA